MFLVVGYCIFKYIPSANVFITITIITLFGVVEKESFLFLVIDSR